jgi:hypothetical protein
MLSSQHAKQQRDAQAARFLGIFEFVCCIPSQNCMEVHYLTALRAACTCARVGNHQYLSAGYSRRQVEEARAEVLSRLPPGAAEFLRGRSRRKSEAGSTPPATSTTEAGSSHSIGGGGSAAAPGAASIEQQHAAAADAQRRLHSAGEMPPRPGRGGGGDNSGGAAPAAASAAARLRFSVEGRPVGFASQSASATPSAADVLQRDPLRCGGGSMVPCTCACMKFRLQICRCTGWGTRTAECDCRCGLQQPVAGPTMLSSLLQAGRGGRAV